MAQAAEGCFSRHEGIERFTDGSMMEQIEDLGAEYGDPAGCVVCHGGTPEATTAEAAHQDVPDALAESDGPQRFFPGPGAVWIACKTCGQCHTDQAARLTKSPMNTEAGNDARWGGVAELECEQ